MFTQNFCAICRIGVHGLRRKGCRRWRRIGWHCLRRKGGVSLRKKGVGTVHAEKVGIIGGIVYMERGHHLRIRGPNSKVKKLFECMALF